MLFAHLIRNENSF